MKLSHSKLSVFNTCRRKFFYEYVRELEPKQFNSSLNTGKLFHLGMETMYKTGDLGAVDAVIFNASEEVDTSAWTQAEFMDYEKDITMIQGMLHGAYDIFYLRDQEKNVKVLEVESEYVLETGSDNQYHLILDLLLEIDGKVCLVEYKTASRLGDAYFARLRIDLQTRCMATVLNGLENKKIEKIIFRIIKKPGIRVKQTEQTAAYLERLRDEFISKPNDYFIEQEFIFTEKEQEAAGEYIQIMQQEVKETCGRNRFPQNTSICSLINCAFLPLCCSEENVDLYKEKERRG